MAKLRADTRAAQIIGGEITVSAGLSKLASTPGDLPREFIVHDGTPGGSLGDEESSLTEIPGGAGSAQHHHHHQGDEEAAALVDQELARALDLVASVLGDECRDAPPAGPLSPAGSQEAYGGFGRRRHGRGRLA